MEDKLHQRVMFLIVVCFLDLATKTEVDEGGMYIRAWQVEAWKPSASTTFQVTITVSFCQAFEE